MEHLAEHPHAFTVGNDVVLVAVFAEHDEELINLIRESNSAEQAICCCNIGVLPSPGWTWDGTTFIEPYINNTDEI